MRDGKFIVFGSVWVNIDATLRASEAAGTFISASLTVSVLPSPILNLSRMPLFDGVDRIDVL